jgi:peptide deformylase
MKPGNHKLNLRIFPDEILRRTCAPVEDFNGELRDIFHEMLVLMRANNGIGLAGPQAGIPSRLFVCEIEDQVLCLANPVITIVEGESRMLEGCLSLPGIQVDVLRHEHILVKGQDISGKEKKFSMTGLWARVTQHETDHLDGILISDRGKIIEPEADETAVRHQEQH